MSQNIFLCDDITKGKALLFIERLPDAFLLASEARLLVSEALLLELEARLLASEALLLVSEAFLLESKALLLESETFLLESETFLLEAEAFLLDSDTFLLEAEAFLLEEEASLLEVDAFLLELEVPLPDLEAFFLEAENIATSLNFGPEDIFKALVGTRFPLMRMDGISCFDFNEEPLLVVILFDGVFFLASFFGFAVAILLVLDDLETFLVLLICEEEDFLDFLFLLETEALLKSSSSSLLTSRCIFLVLDFTMFYFFYILTSQKALIDWRNYREILVFIGCMCCFILTLLYFENYFRIFSELFSRIFVSRPRKNFIPAAACLTYISHYIININQTQPRSCDQS